MNLFLFLFTIRRMKIISGQKCNVYFQSSNETCSSDSWLSDSSVDAVGLTMDTSIMT